MIEFGSFISYPTPLTQIFDELFIEKEVEVYVKRDDLTHPIISGNKFRKLKYSLLEAKKNNFSKLLTFGGAYSNHIAAIAEASCEFGFETTVIIRGDELNENSSPTLQRAYRKGLKLEFVTRIEYRNKQSFFQKYEKDHFIIPEGGTLKTCLPGVSEMVDEILFDVSGVNYICAAVGTGGTFAGIVSNKKYTQNIIGVPVLKGLNSINFDISILLDSKSLPPRVLFFNDYHFGGYAKSNSVLDNFVGDFEHKHNIEIEPIYTGKLFYAIYDKIKEGFFEKKSKIVMLHSGGLQGKTKKNQL